MRTTTAREMCVVSAVCRTRDAVPRAKCLVTTVPSVRVLTILSRQLWLTNTRSLGRMQSRLPYALSAAMDSDIFFKTTMSNGQKTMGYALFSAFASSFSNHRRSHCRAEGRPYKQCEMTLLGMHGPVSIPICRMRLRTLDMNSITVRPPAGQRLCPSSPNLLNSSARVRWFVRTLYDSCWLKHVFLDESSVCAPIRH